MILQHLKRKSMITLKDLVLAGVSRACYVNMLNRLAIVTTNGKVIIMDHLANTVLTILLRCTCLTAFVVSTGRVKAINGLTVMKGREWTISVLVETVTSV